VVVFGILNAIGVEVFGKVEVFLTFGMWTTLTIFGLCGILLSPEVKLCAQIARYYADNAKQFLAPVPYKTEFGDAWVEHHPIGVI
ncbi:hypothetical protein ONR49_25605, partial [Salmonella enterica subsp. enterica serovar Virginia]|nr:hypothetical protein [Salmonella enterica subsp. enterica serovar Virginia]